VIETREEYLTAAVERFRPLYTRNKLDIPEGKLLKVSCGFPCKTPKKTIGQCFSPECTFDGSVHIFVSPIVKSTVEVLGVLTHELLHSCLPSDAKHGPKFKEGMKLIGLEGKAIHAMPGDELLALCEKIADELGDYPNPVLKIPEKSQKERANSKKSFKLHCESFRNGEKTCRLIEVAKGGEYTVTASKKSLKLGFPLCPGCSKEMEMEPEDFEIYKLSLD
jgi:hypothetical protein